jgi:hypothetical protein
LTIRFYNLCPSGTYYVINHFWLDFVYSYFEHAISYQIAMFDGEWQNLALFIPDVEWNALCGNIGIEYSSRCEVFSCMIVVSNSSSYYPVCIVTMHANSKGQ